MNNKDQYCTWKLRFHRLNHVFGNGFPLARKSLPSTSTFTITKLQQANSLVTNVILKEIFVTRGRLVSLTEQENVLYFVSIGMYRKLGKGAKAKIRNPLITLGFL